MATRKGFRKLDLALKAASIFADSAPDGSRTVRVWGRVMRDRTERFDVLDLSEKPVGEGWAQLYEVKRVGED